MDHTEDAPAENINRRLHRAQAASSCPVCINPCPKRHSKRVKEGETKDFRRGARVDGVATNKPQRAKKKGGQFYGFVDIFSGTKGSGENPGKTKEQTNDGSDDVK